MHNFAILSALSPHSRIASPEMLPVRVDVLPVPHDDKIYFPPVDQPLVPNLLIVRMAYRYAVLSSLHRPQYVARPPERSNIAPVL
jgi:hypothetical protein